MKDQNLYLSLLLLLIFHVALYSKLLVGAFDAQTDKQALLTFKLGISVDSQNVLSNWNQTTSHCTWLGVSCTTTGTNSRVSSLNLTGLGLFGPLSPHLSNLTSLQNLDLSLNNFYGPITFEFTQLSLLKNLVLFKNSITGTIPASLSQCYNLINISLSFNNLTGQLPPELGALSRLKVLDFSGNNLTGSVPHTFGNLSALSTLLLARNKLSGKIPNRFGGLSNLVTVYLSENQFTGEFPLSIFNISSLVLLSLAQNNFTGKFRRDMGFQLPNLKELYLGQNMFEGSIPDSLLSNFTRIQFLDLSVNHFQGPIPSLRNLNRLKFLNLGSNHLSSTTELNFQLFDSLANSTQLDTLILYSNQLAGELPNSIANLSAVLTHFCLDNNHFSGSFPRGIGRLQNLISISIQNNSFTGQLPRSIGSLYKLQKMTLQQNFFSGEIPDMFVNLTHLYILTMGANRFSGKIPISLGSCQSLHSLDVAWNNLVGTVPKEIFGIHNLNVLYLATNSLNGSLPIELGTMKHLEFMDVSGNQLSGNLPETIGGCSSMRYLNLARNNLTGSIPISMGNLLALENLDLSSNNFSGSIPEELEKLLLGKLNLSFNHLEGLVPRNGVFLKLGWDSFQGNYKLCGNDKEVVERLRIPLCVTKNNSSGLSLFKIVIVVVSCIAFVCVMFCLIWALVSRKMRKKMQTRGGISSPSIKGLPPMISYYDIQRATNGFAEENLIGKGSFGSVYKGLFGTDESEVYATLAVKVLDLNQSKALKTFNAECEALRSIRHRNLVRVVTSCSSIDQRGSEFKALLMEYMSNGNLDMWLHPKESESQWNLSLTQRLEIAIDVASAVDYLHHDCEPPIVHCDLKPPNILLDDNLRAHVGDFGLARFLHPNSPENKSSTLGLKGSIGYIAPEYGLGSKVSTRGDVYSFGILLLEIFTAKRPTDEMFKDGLSLNKFASEGQENLVFKMADTRLFTTENIIDSSEGNSTSSSNGGLSSRSKSKVTNNWECKMEQCLSTLIRIGLTCAADSARDRLTMRETLAKLHEIKKILLE